MKRLAGRVLFLFVLQIASAVPQEQTDKLTIEGVVVRSDNGQPLAGAQVTLTRFNPAPGTAVGAAGGGIVVGIAGGIVAGGAPLPAPAPATQIAPPGQIAPATTDSDGKFAFKDLEAGTYRMVASATGYTRQEYSSRPMAATAGNGTPIILTAGQSLKNAAIRLLATGTVSGRILDENGQPAIGVPVLVLQYAYDNTGNKTLRQIGTGNADDRGEYRIYGLTPGRYFVGMGNGPGPLQAGRGGRGGASGQPAGVNYAFNYFPGVTDVSQASVVEIKSGGEGFINMTLKRQQMRSVRGRVTDARGQLIPGIGARGQSPVSISLAYTLFSGSGTFSSGRGYDPATGSFEIQNVLPGTYTVQAQMQDTTVQTIPLDASNIQERQAAQAMRPIAETPIVVGDADVENILLTFTTPVAVPGKLSIEGQDLSSTPYNQIRLQFRRMMNGALFNIGNPPPVPSINADGTFQVAGLRTGEYLATLFGVPPAYYVKSLQFDNKDILGRPLEFSGSAGSGFSVVLSPKAGTVQGTVTDAKMQSAPGAQAVLIPSVRSRTDLYKNSSADQNGRYTFTGVTPGDYKLFAWDGMEAYRYFDSEFMKTYETKGQTVHVGESLKVAADVQVTTIPQE